MLTTFTRILDTRDTDRRMLIRVGSQAFAAGIKQSMFYVELLTPCCSRSFVSFKDTYYCLQCRSEMVSYIHTPTHSGYGGNLRDCCHLVFSYWLPLTQGSLEGEMGTQRLALLLEDRLGDGWTKSWGLTKMEL